MEVLDNIDSKILETIKKSYMPLSTSDFFKVFDAKTRYQKDQIRMILDDLDKQGYITYDSISGVKEKLILPSMIDNKKFDFTFPGMIYPRDDINIQVFIGFADLEKIGRVARIAGFRGDINGFQRMRQRSWVLELARVFQGKETFLFTSIVLFFDQKDVIYKNNQLQIVKPPWKYEDEKPGLIVDGQQRCTAFHELVIYNDEVAPLITPIVAIIGKPNNKSVLDFLKVLFINANKTKPLPRSLIDQLLATLDNIDSQPIVDKLKRHSRFGKMLIRIDENPASPLHDKIAFDYKTNSVDCPFNFNVAEYQLKYLEKALKQYNSTNEIEEELLISLYIEIFEAIKKVYTEIFDLILLDTRTIGPLFVFITRILSADMIYSGDRIQKLINAFTIISDFIGLEPVNHKPRKWKDGIGEWNPNMMQGRSRPVIEDAANNLLKMYITSIRRR